MSEKRDFESPEYKAWRNAVFARDRFVCQMTQKKGGHLEAHHIISWAKCPELRYVVSNGITLSKESHDLVTGREEQFAAYFQKLVKDKAVTERKVMGTQRGVKSTRKAMIKSIDGLRRKHRWRPRNPRIR